MKSIFSNRTHYLYFIQIENSGPIKIGIAKNPQKRLSELQVGCPYKLNIIYFTPCCENDEKELHGVLQTNYAALYLRGEWYLPGEKIFSEINNFKFFDEKDGFNWLYPNPEIDLVDTRMEVKS